MRPGHVGATVSVVLILGSCHEGRSAAAERPVYGLGVIKSVSRSIAAKLREQHTPASSAQDVLVVPFKSSVSTCAATDAGMFVAEQIFLSLGEEDGVAGQFIGSMLRDSRGRFTHRDDEAASFPRDDLGAAFRRAEHLRLTHILFGRVSEGPEGAVIEARLLDTSQRRLVGTASAGIDVTRLEEYCAAWDSQLNSSSATWHAVLSPVWAAIYLEASWPEVAIMVVPEALTLFFAAGAIVGAGQGNGAAATASALVALTIRATTILSIRNWAAQQSPLDRFRSFNSSDAPGSAAMISWGWSF